MGRFQITEQDRAFMKEAIRLAEESIDLGGGPFGAVIVKDGEVLASTSNSVTIDNDPTAHAEVNCIRMACKALGTFDLSGCVIYSSCEPCPMCLGAIYWAHIDRIYYAGDRKDAAKVGFDDDFIYRELAKDMSERTTPIISMMPAEGVSPFDKWRLKTDRIDY
ncbi:MAG: nucleoside deaminase [Bacteroidales bacterium]|nr:nucleoside deaminase [Bacteroidales bacterium]